MGLTFSGQNIVNNVTDYISGKKRKHSESDDEEINKIIDIALHTPKKKKLPTTAQYIYQALFEEGKNSDVTVCAMGTEFYLHKVYICQSPYFASMFGGSWLESTKKFIDIDVVDPLITVDSLKVVFGSLYNSEIILNPLEIVPILATATMFQLDGLIEKCTEVMLETINPKTSLEYYEAAIRYGDKGLQQVCFNWFLVNLMTYYFTRPLINLKSIPINLMTKLISHPDLFVMQTEYSIYVMLKYWMYMLVHPNGNRNNNNNNDDDNDDDEDDDENDGAPTVKHVNRFYCSRKGQLPYLWTDEGKPFAETFKCLRLHHLIAHQMDIELVLHDNIIPHNWLNPVVLQQWKNVLRVNQNDDKGPCEISDEFFLRTSLRCGRTLTTPERHVWRWTGFHFGMDLLMIMDGISLSIKRNHRSEFEQLLSFQTTRHVAIRVTVVKLNEQRQIVYHRQSEILKLGLAKSEEVQLMTLDKDMEYPIIISANILYTSPDTKAINHEEIVQTIA